MQDDSEVIYRMVPEPIADLGRCPAPMESPMVNEKFW